MGWTLFHVASYQKKMHTYIWIELPINEQVMHRVGDLDTKVKKQEMTK